MTPDMEREIYEAAQMYRNWPITDQKGVSVAFEIMVDTIWNAAIKEACAMERAGGLISALKH